MQSVSRPWSRGTRSYDPYDLSWGVFDVTACKDKRIAPRQTPQGSNFQDDSRTQERTGMGYGSKLLDSKVNPTILFILYKYTIVWILWTSCAVEANQSLAITEATSFVHYDQLKTKTETKTCLYCILITHLQDHNTLSEKYSSCRSKTKRHPWLIIVHSFHSFHSSTFLSTAGILDRWELGIWTCARPGEVRPLILRLSLSSWEVKSVLEGWDTSFDWKTSVGMLDWNNMDI